MPGEYQFQDIETLVKCKVFQDLILTKANQKASFLVYTAHKHKHIFLYEIIKGTEITLKDVLHLKRPIDLNTFKHRITVESHIDSDRKIETVFEYNNIYIGIISTEDCHIIRSVLDRIFWEPWDELNI